MKDISPKMFLRLYLEYIRSLFPYFVAEPAPSEREAKRIVSEYLEDPMSDIIPIFADTEEPAGFLVVCRRGGDCHPWADYFIAQLFVCNEHRRKNLAEMAVAAFVKGHPGVYCYDVLIGNKTAICFWDYMEKKYGWKKESLPEIRPAEMVSDICLRAFCAR